MSVYYSNQLRRDQEELFLWSRKVVLTILTRYMDITTFQTLMKETLEFVKVHSLLLVTQSKSLSKDKEVMDLHLTRSETLSLLQQWSILPLTLSKLETLIVERILFSQFVRSKLDILTMCSLTLLK